jgi:uncharacterized protein (TIGR03000 family)
MRYCRRIASALVLSIVAAQSASAQFFRRPLAPIRPITPVRPFPFIDTSWQNNPYVYWTIHHHGMPYPYPYPPRPYPYPMPYPVPMGPGYTTVNNYYTPRPELGQAYGHPITSLLPPPQANKAVVAINLPTTAAVVWIDGQKLESGLNATRVYTTPELEPGHKYQYMVKAEWVQRGQNVSEERGVSVEPGKTTVVDFTMEKKE